MSTFLSKEVLAGLEAAQKTELKKKNRFRVEFNKKHYPVIRLTKRGFCVEAEKAPKIRGRVELYDRDKHLKQGLIVAAKEENGIVYFDYKRNTTTQASAPKDFFQKNKVMALSPRLL
jgi:hypothetical protein